jgi:hypothetical protein
MRCNRFLVAAVLAVPAAFLSAATTTEAKSPLPWVRDDYRGALAEARSRGVPIFVENWAPW